MEKSPEDALREKLRPKKPLRVQEERDVSQLAKMYPYYRDVQMSTMAKTQWESDERSKLFQWKLSTSTGDWEGNRAMLADRRECRPLCLKNQHPLLVADSFTSLTTVEEKKHLDDLAKAQQVSRDTLAAPLMEKPVKKLGLAVILMIVILGISWVYSKK